MANNIVILGPPDSGKSTIAGLLKARSEGASWFRKQLHQIQQSLGNKYCYTDKYALLVDTHADERRRRIETEHGKSQYMHPARALIENLDVLLIDTPGTEKYHREQFRGLYYGDIAVLVVEISQFAKGENEEERMRRLFGDFKGLVYWLGLAKQRGGLVVVISKMDTVAFADEVFLDAAKIATQIIDSMLQERIHAGGATLPYTVIPSGIEITTDDELNSDLDHNIESQSKSLAWFLGPTLVSAVRSLLESSNIAAAAIPEDSFLMCIRSRHQVAHAKPAGTILTGKIISGSVSENDALKIVPAEYRGEWGSVDVTCGEIRPEKSKNSISRAMAGQMVSLNLIKHRFHERRARVDFAIPSSAIVVSRSTRCLIGSVIEFDAQFNAVADFAACEKVQILWYGRAIVGSVVFSDRCSGRLCVEFSTAPAAVIDDARVAPDSKSFILRPSSREPGASNWFEFMEVTLRSVCSPSELLYECATNVVFNSETVGKAIISVRQFPEPATEVRIVDIASYEATIRAIIRAEHAQGHTSADVFSRIKLMHRSAERC